MIEDKVDYDDEINRTTNQINSILQEKAHQKLINFQETYKPYKLYEELKGIGISNNKANKIKKLYRDGVYYLIQLELQYLKSQKG